MVNNVNRKSQHDMKTNLAAVTEFFTPYIVKTYVME